jgi:transposase InsO family protein
MADDPDLTIALWRYELIAPLLSTAGQRGALRRELRRLAERTHEHPKRGPVRMGCGTFEDWYYLYRRHGLDGLRPQTRKDHGRSRRIGAELAEQITTLARARPDLDGRNILAELRCQGLGPLPSMSTLYRFLRAQGLDQRRAPSRADHRAYSFELAGDCWQADVMYGPSLPAHDGSRRKTYLFAILDDATRLIAHAQFYAEQHLRSLKDCLKQAFLKRGLPRRVYVDNGRIFRSRMILQLAARLGIHLLHSRPYRPQGRAKLERWFGTVRTNFLARLDTDRLDGLDALNRLLWAWVEGEYHVRPHRGLEGETPLDRWLRLSQAVRPLSRDIDLDTLFLEEATRRVAKDGTFTLRGKRFEAGPLLIGLRVRVLFDPFDLRRVTVHNAQGRAREAFPVDLEANRRVARTTPPSCAPPPPPPLRSLEALAAQLDTDNTPEDPHDD